jgi:hypothetical protein
MFLDEARLTSRLHHQGIVSIVDFGIEGGRPFQVLELVDGADAWRLWKAGAAQGRPLPPALALHVCAQVGHALHFAHCAQDDAGAPLNIVHRDVSPQNVLLSRAGDVKLSDFGVAFAEGRLEKTVGGIARGKPAYMAPEQAVRGPMDGRTDVFALGCVLHALFTGESALRDENALVDLLAGLALPLDSSLPGDVREVIAKAVQRDKHARYESAEAFAAACAALLPKYSSADPRTELAGWVRSVALEPPVRPAPAPRPRSARRWLGAASALGVALAGLVGLSQLGGGASASKAAPGGVGRVEASPSAAAPPPSEAPAPKRVEPVPQVPPPVARPKPPPTTKRFGVLAVGGERLLRGEVRLDGRLLGVAPARFDVELGPHQLEVTLPSGERVGPRAVTVGAQHTALAPLYVLE